jgi:hypothetical protein
MILIDGRQIIPIGSIRLWESTPEAKAKICNKRTKNQAIDIAAI